MSRPAIARLALTPCQRAERDRRIDAHRHLVAITVKLTPQSALVGLEFEDRLSIGYLALVEAAESYDPSRSQFSTYAITKIRHALLEANRTWRPGKRNHSHRVFLTSLHAPLLSAEGESRLLEEMLPDDDDVFATVAEGLAQEHLQRAIERLPDRERTVIVRHFLEGITFRQIGEEIGISESRAYQLHVQALKRLRDRLEEQS